MSLSISSVKNCSVPNESRLNTTCSLAKKVFFYLIGAASDLALLPAAGILALFACYKSNFDPKVHQVKKDKVPILFIHGNGYNEMQWVVGRHLLSKDQELGSMFSLNLDGLVTNQINNGIDDYALKVAIKIEEIKKLTNRNDIIFVVHSMGGLIGTYYTEYLSEKQNTKVDRIIAISTPWSGSPTLNALTKITEYFFPSLFKTPKRYKQMRNEDNFLDDLKNKAVFSKKTKYYSLYSTADGFVPGDSGKLNDDPNCNEEYSWMGHYMPMVAFSPWRKIHSWLKVPQ